MNHKTKFKNTIQNKTRSKFTVLSLHDVTLLPPQFTVIALSLSPRQISNQNRLLLLLRLDWWWCCCFVSVLLRPWWIDCCCCCVTVSIWWRRWCCVYSASAIMDRLLLLHLCWGSTEAATAVAYLLRLDWWWWWSCCVSALLRGGFNFIFCWTDWTYFSFCPIAWSIPSQFRHLIGWTKQKELFLWICW